MADHKEPWLGREIRRLQDIQEIAELKARYCRFIDTKDWTSYGSLLTEDFQLSSGGGVHNGREEVVAFVSKTLAHATTVHHVHNPEITFVGPDAATGVWAMNDYVSFPGDESPFVLRGYGHYHEDYVRTHDGWRIRKSVQTRLRVDTEGGVPADAAERPG